MAVGRSSTVANLSHRPFLSCIAKDRHDRLWGQMIGLRTGRSMRLMSLLAPDRGLGNHGLETRN